MTGPQVVGFWHCYQAEGRNPALLSVPPIRIFMTILVLLICLICLAPLSGYIAAAASVGQTMARPTVTHGGYPSVLAGGPAQAATATRDTIYILGGPDRTDGKFQDPDSPSLPDPQGWAGWTEWPDPSVPESYWHVDTFNAELLDPDYDPNHAMWCGMVFNTCDPPNPGYGNNWDESLEWYGTVPDTGTLASLTARLNYDTESDYDFLYLELERADGWDALLSYDGNNRVGGIFVPVDVEVTFEVFPEDLVGPEQNQMHLRWHFVSDGAWSDEDCQYDTDGAAQIDNIAVYLGDLGAPELLTFDDFEPGSDMNWIPVSTSTECSYAQVWQRLYDQDTCHENSTPQFAFVDNGEQCGGPGSPGIIWTYGPDGYVVHYETDIPFPLLETDEVWSPPLAWPEGDYDSAILAFDVYEHSTPESSQFTIWRLRTSSDGGISWSDWKDFNFVYYILGPEYSRRELPISSLLEPGMTHIQLSLGHIWPVGLFGYPYEYLTPAPYYDNVALKAYTNGGPALTARVIDQAQDAFPESGSINLDDLSQFSVRFDMARNISPPLHQRNDPGDSLVIDAVAVRAGAVLTGPPHMHWRLLANPLFDPYRTASPANPVVGDSVYTAAGTLVEDRWSFDLPDSGFLFPGDIIRYYFVAQDDAGGNIGTSLLPADTTGYSHLPGPGSQVTSVYPSEFTQRALPTMFTATEGSQPGILLWYDQDGPAGMNEWSFALANLGYHEGIEYDMYLTKGAASGVGNGLGGRATPAQVGGYEVILYSCGDLSHYTLGNGDYDSDAGDDIGLLTAWLMSGSKSLLATGDHLAYDLAHAGSEAEAFLTEILGLGFLADDVQTLVGMQTSPLVMPVAGAPVFHPADRWYLYGGCPDLRRFDAVEATGSAQRLAEFADPEGLPGMYPYSAATLNENSTFDAKVVSLPYDLSSVRTSQAGGGLRQPIAARTHLLYDVLTYFGQVGTAPTDVPDAEVLFTRTYPNPFNPRVTIEYSVPYRDRLTVRIYNLRGYLVKTLLDERVDAGPGRVIWDGTDAEGGAVASGVYFVDIRQREQSRLHKLALVR